MDKKKYDTFIIGDISKDEIIYKGLKETLIGGAVIYSSYSSAAGKYKVGVLTKVSSEDMELLNNFNIDKDDVYHIISKETTSIRNEYLSDDRERRICTALSVADPFVPSDIPDVESLIYHFAGLIAGEFEPSLIEYLSKKGKIALDLQGFLRHVDVDKMVFKDWEDKNKYLPLIDFLKADAAEAEVISGCSDKREAAKMLFSFGAKEIMITSNHEVLIYDGEEFYSEPLKPRDLSGRTGRGDTCFSAYITKRLHKGIKESLLYTAALTSLKLETPGPFKGDSLAVVDYINKFY